MMRFLKKTPKLMGVIAVVLFCALTAVILRALIPKLFCHSVTELGHGYTYAYGDQETHILKAGKIVVDMNVLRFSIAEPFIVGMRRVEPDHR